MECESLWVTQSEKALGGGWAVTHGVCPLLVPTSPNADPVSEGLWWAVTHGGSTRVSQFLLEVFYLRALALGAHGRAIEEDI